MQTMTSGVIEGFELSPKQRRRYPRGGVPGVGVAGVLALDGPLAPGAAEGALRALGARHEILRTVFRSLPGMLLPIQVVLDEPRWSFLEVDLGALPAAAAQARIRELFDAIADEPFDLAEGPTARFVLVRLADDRHRLLAALSSLAGDAPSLANLGAELLAALAGESPGSGEGEGEEPVQYLDFATWANEQTESDEGRAAREAWLAQGLRPERLSKLRPDIAHEGRERCPGAGTPAFGTLETALDPTLVARLATVAASCDAPFESVLFGAWAALAWRLGEGGDETVIGWCDPGRPFDSLHAALGPYAAALPVRCRFDGEIEFPEVVQALAEDVAAAAARAEQFSWSAAGLAAEDGTFPLAFRCDVWPEERTAGALAASWLALRDRSEPVDLLLRAVRRGDAWTLALDYREDLYAPARIARLADSYAAILDALATSPEAPAVPVAELPIVGAAEARLLVDTWNDTATSVPICPGGTEEGRCLHELFAEQVDRTPAAPAASLAGVEITFAELDRRANRLAHRLRRQGVGAESRVALLAERSLDALVALLAILKAGGAYAPLDANQPRERLALLLADLAPRAVVATAESLVAALPPLEVPVICLATESFDGESALRPVTTAAPDNLAYVLYTSGSTGRPKGVMIPHRSVANLAYALRDAVYEGSSGPLRVGVNAPLQFDASVKQVVQWLHGHAICPIPEELRVDGAGLLAYARSERLDVLDGTPAQLRILLDAGLAGAEYPRRMLIGGEAIDPALWDALARAAAPSFWNVYGPTECTVDATACRIAGGAPTIGRPIPNVRVHLLDARRRLVPIGAVGELCIAGAGVGRGYLARPEVTAERFVPDPFATEPGARLYRTGDLACRRADGAIEFLGRLDFQVKVRGHRIELGEIEATLLRHPGVAAAVAMVREDVPGDRRLVAYAVPQKRAARADGRPRHTLPNGLAVAHQNRNETEYLYREIFDKGSYALHGVELPAGATIVDVGANIGMFTLYASLCGPGARIYAFEPIGALFDDLAANVLLHGVDARLFRCGLSDREGTARFSFYRRYSMMSGLAEYADPEDEVRVIKRFLENEREAGGGAASELLDQADQLLAGRFEHEVIESRLRRLSDVVREEGIERIDLLKIDVQRAELDVLHGIDDEHWERIEQVVMEVHDASSSPNAGSSAGRLDEILALLRRHGFDALAEQDELLVGTDRHNLYAVKPRGARRLTAEPGRPPVPAIAAPAAEDLTGALLREFLRRELPEPMVPSDCVLLAELPLTRNGKVDRAALPAPMAVAAGGAGGASGAVEAPRGPVEETLAAIWGGLLRVERIAPSDDFFALGGHSLLATQLVSRVREAFAVELPIRTVFEAPTLRAQAARLAESAAGAPPLPAIEAGSLAEPAPLSFAQRRLWLIDRLAPGTALYNNPFALRLLGPLRPPLHAALAAALDEIVRRHAVLRTVFAERRDQGAEPEQVVLPWRRGALPLPLADLSALPRGRAEESGRIVDAVARAPFDLACGPLVRARLVRASAGEHLLLVTLHHVVCDGWSLDVLGRELGALTSAFAALRPAALPELPVQYADYARWQRRWITDEVLADRLAAWRERLADLDAELPLPTDRPGAGASAASGSAARPSASLRRPFRLEPEPSARLRALGRECGATPFMTLLGALAALVARHADVDDLAIGSPVAGRDRLEIEGLVGFFVNTLVLRLDLAGDPTGKALLARARAAALYAHQHEVPFETLVDALGHAGRLERRLGRSPLFRVLFALGNEPTAELSLPGLAVEPLAVDAGVARLDLSVIVEETADGLGGFFEAAVDLFDPGTVERLSERFRALLAGLAAEPQRRLSDLPFLAPGEAEQLRAFRRAGGEPRGAHPAATTVPAVLALAAARDREAPAILDRGAVVSYGELAFRVDALADRLRRRGIGLETEVGLCLPRSTDLIVALLAVLEAGGAFVPLDPAAPEERLALMLDDARPALVLARSSMPAAIAAAGVPVLALDEPREDEDGDLGPAERSAPLPESAAYRLYTSGSTGRPKGVVVEHAGLCNLIEAQIRAFRVEAGARVLQFAAPGFDAAIAEILVALGAGAALVLADREDLLPGPGLVALLRERAITHATLPPSVLAELPTELSEPAAELAADPLPSVATLVVAGEACPPALAARWAAGRRFLNAYGPTEATVCATIEEAYEGSGPLAIGRPMAGVETTVRSAALALVPPGVAGELCIGGVGVARGYAGRPDLTALSFVPDPDGPPGARLYRSGDRVRQRPDGRLDFLGRLDRQVKVRGVRIEPGEVEAALAAHPAVRAAAVELRRLDDDEAGLVAWVVGRDGGDLATDLSTRLRADLRALLPEAAIPAAFVVVDALPLTPHGKVDRAALPDPRPPSRPAPPPSVAANPVEAVLAGIWSEVLRLDVADRNAPLAADADFFALGGHSLLATRVMARVEAAFGVGLPLRALFEAPTVSGLARAIAAARAAGARSPAPPLAAARRPAVIPLSFAQQRLWFLDQLDPGSARYNLPAPVLLEGRLDGTAVAAIRAALDGLVARHEALRTSFPAHGGRPRQAIAPIAASPGRTAVPLPLVELAALPAARGDDECARLAAADAARPFDLATGPVLRAALVRTGAAGGALLLSVHHIASDARSLEILLDEVAALAARAGGEPLPPLPLQPADVALWQRGWLAGDALAARVDFWRAALAGAPPLLDLPVDRPRPAQPSSRGVERSVLPKVAPAALRAVARRAVATPYLVALAAFAGYLGRVTGQDDLCLGTPVAGRDRVEMEGLIGFFVNTLVLRADLAGDPTGGELVARVRATLLAAHEHGDLPFEKLVEELRPERDLGHEPLFQALFGFGPAPRALPPLAGLAIRPLEVPGAAAKLDLSLSLLEGDEAIAGSLTVRRDLFDDATAARLAAGFERVLAGLVADPERRLSELPLLAPSEVAQIDRFGRTAPEFALEFALEFESVPARFARQARAQPEAPAVACGDEEVSFGELDRRSARLARSLAALGVGAEVRVALLAERSVGLLVGVLGVLRAGGALVPLDPAQPAARLAFLLDDSGASVLLVEEGRDDGSAPLAQLGPAGCRVVVLDRKGGVSEDGADAAARDREVERGTAAYLIYTSGTTGRPKAVLAEHGGLAHLLAAVHDRFDFRPGDRMPCLAPATFDIFFFELLAPLLAGATVALVATRPALDLDRLVREVEQATHLHAVPTLMRQVVDEMRRRGRTAPRLRTLFVGGDAVPPDLLTDLGATFPDASIRVLYGPTEGTILASSHLVEAGERGRLWLGRPLPGVEIRVCDRRGTPVGIGSPGEVWIGGPGVARGYLGRPELTAERFVPGAGGGRFYRTGDLARWLATGELEFLGRADDQVKVRGVRIEPGEVEAALVRLPEVAAAAVAVRGARLVAWLVASEGRALPSAAALRARLAETLPDAMIPAAFVALAALPLTAHGKVDRAALPEPGRERPEVGADDVAPRSRAEEILARIWAAVLGLERVGVHDNYFALGGDSILSIQIVARAQGAGLRLAPRQLFEHQTVAELAAAATDGGVAVDAEQGPVVGPVPLSPIERRFFAREPIDPHHFNQALLLTVDADSGARLLRLLKPAVAALLAHHDALRLRFRRAGAAWEQEIAAPDGAAPCGLVDLSALDRKASNHAASNRLVSNRLVSNQALAGATAALQAGFDLARGPLLRAVLLDLGPRGLRLWLGAHHLAVDAVSWRILLEDLQTLWRQLDAGEAASLPAKTTSWRRWSERVDALARSGARRHELDFWLGAPQGEQRGVRLGGVPAGTVEEARTLAAGLDATATRLLVHDAPAALRAQVHEILLAALALALRRAGHRGPLVIDVEGHGREDVFPDVDLTRTVGWFTTIHPLALDLPAAADATAAAAALAETKRRVREIPDRGFGYGLLRYLDGDAAARLAARPEPEVAFNYLGRIAADGDGPFRLASDGDETPESAGMPRSPRAAREHALETSFWVEGERLHVELTYGAAAGSRAAEALVAGLLGALGDLLALAGEGGGVAPATTDFPLLDVGQADLDALIGEVDFEGQASG